MSIAIASLLALLAAVPVPEIVESEICYSTGQCLSDDQEAFYERADSEAAVAIEECESPVDCAGVIEEYFWHFERAEVLPAVARRFLQGSLSEKLARRFQACGPVFLHFLKSSSPVLHGVVINALLNSEGTWSTCESVSGQLQRLVANHETESATRESLLWLFLYEGALEQIRDEVYDLARSDPRRDGSQVAAEVIVEELSDSEMAVAALGDLVLNGSGSLQQQAARLVLTDSRFHGNSRLLAKAIETVEEVAKSSSYSPVRRGFAVQALSLSWEQPSAVPVILSLLEPANWFYGASGQHFLVHSLGVMIPTLSRSESEEIQVALRGLWQKVDLIRVDEGRDYVKWCLRNWVPIGGRKTPNKSLQRTKPPASRAPWPLNSSR